MPRKATSNTRPDSHVRHHVVERDGLVTCMWTAESSAIDPLDPAHLEFEYMQHVQIAADSMFEAGVSIRALHLGGADAQLARAIDAVRPGSRQLAVEIDPRACHARARMDRFAALTSASYQRRGCARDLDTNRARGISSSATLLLPGVSPAS